MKPTHILTKVKAINPNSTGVTLNEKCKGIPVLFTLKVGWSFYFRRTDGLYRITSPIKSIIEFSKKTTKITTANSKYKLTKI